VYKTFPFWGSPVAWLNLLHQVVCIRCPLQSYHLAHRSEGYTMRNRLLRSWCAAVVLAVLALCVRAALAGDQARHYQVAVFTNGLTARPVLEGLQEGLAQLGYVEG